MISKFLESMQHKYAEKIAEFNIHNYMWSTLNFSSFACFVCLIWKQYFEKQS